MTLGRDGKEDLILDHHNRYRDTSDWILQWEEETGLNSECSMSKWECVTKEKDGSQWVKDY